MSLMDQIKADARKFLSNGNDFAIPLTFTSPGSPAIVVTVNGLSTKHSISLDGDGNAITGRNTHASVSELELIEAGYPVRNGNNEVDMKNHLITWTDISGVAKTYKIKVQWPDEKLGVILFPELTDYKA